MSLIQSGSCERGFRPLSAERGEYPNQSCLYELLLGFPEECSEIRGVPCTIERYPAPARIADAHEETGAKGLSV